MNCSPIHVLVSSIVFLSTYTPNVHSQLSDRHWTPVACPTGGDCILDEASLLQVSSNVDKRTFQRAPAETPSEPDETPSELVLAGPSLEKHTHASVISEKLHAEPADSVLSSAQEVVPLMLPPWPQISSSIVTHLPIPTASPWSFTDVSILSYIFILFVVFDVAAATRMSYALRNHILSLVLMIMVSVAVFAVFYFRRGEADGKVWATGYTLEWAFCLDNLFVYHILFEVFSVPKAQSQYAMTVGMYAAFAHRCVMIMCLRELFRLHIFVGIFLGVILIIFGLASLLFDDSELIDVHELRLVRWFKWLFGSRLKDSYTIDGSLFTTSETGRFQITVLFLVVCVVAVMDPFFSLDCIAYKTSQIQSLHINVTSTFMGMFSMRSMFFITRDMAGYFEYLKYGICAILLIAGAELIASTWITIPLMPMWGLILSVLTTSVLASVFKVAVCGEPERRSKGKAQHTETEAPATDARSGDKLEADTKGLLQQQRAGATDPRSGDNLDTASNASTASTTSARPQHGEDVKQDSKPKRRQESDS